MKLEITVLYYAGIADCGMTRKMKLDRAVQMMQSYLEQYMPRVRAFDERTHSEIVMRAQAEINELPPLGERGKINITAAPCGSYSFEYRYEMVSERGEARMNYYLTTAVRSEQANRLVHLPEEYMALERILAPKKIKKLDFSSVDFEEEMPIQLRYGDFDKNRHVNNTMYYSFMTLAKAADISAREPAEIIVNYHGGIPEGSRCTLKTHCEPSEGEIRLSQSLATDDGVAAELFSRWRSPR